MNSPLSVGDYVIANTFANGKFVGEIVKMKESFAVNKPVFVVADLASDFVGSVASGYCVPATKENIEALENEERKIFEAKWNKVKTRVLA